MVVRDAVALLASNRTARLGHVLAPLGVRYIAVIDRPAPGAHLVRKLPPGLGSTLAGQLDLSLRQSEQGLTLYENGVWSPTRAVARVAPPTTGDPTAAAIATDLSTAKPLPQSASAGRSTACCTV